MDIFSTIGKKLILHASSFIGVRIGYLVLCYHQIVPLDDPGIKINPSLKVNVDTFERHLTYFKKVGSFLSHAELIQRLRDKIYPDRLYITVTFDDGYENNYQYALPILKRFGVPATIFLTTGFIDYPEKIPWWDELEEFALNYHGRIHIKQNSFSNKYNLSRIDRKRQFFDDISRIICRDYKGRKVILNALQSESRQTFRRENSFLRWEKIRAMQNENISFGAHTCNHPIMSQVKESCAIEEAVLSKKRIEEKLNIEVNTFAIPYGQPFTYTKTILRELSKRGFHAFFTTIPGINYCLDPYLINRVCPMEGNSGRTILGMPRAFYMISHLRQMLGHIYD